MKNNAEESVKKIAEESVNTNAEESVNNTEPIQCRVTSKNDVEEPVNNNVDS